MPVCKASPLIAGLMALGLAACAHYTPLPLNPSARYAASVGELKGSSTAPALTETDVINLVLQNNPSLKLAATRHSEAEAQGRSLALPSNPSFSGSLGYLLSGAGNATAWTAGLAQGVNGWITLKARRDEAKASLGEVDASLAWEAWQDVGKARMLVADIVSGQQLLAVQDELSGVLTRQSQALRQAESQGDIDAATAQPVLLAAEEARAASAETGRTLADRQRELHSLMGLSFDAPMTLAPLPPLLPLDTQACQTAIDGMATHRPDLVALAMGYDAEDARFRQAVLAQFPPLSMGYSASQDNSRVTNGGPALTFDLPVFDHGRARVDAEAATRQRLHDEYASRVADAIDEAHALLAAYQRIEVQLGHEDDSRGDAIATATSASHALGGGDIDQNTYAGLAAADLSRQATRIRWRMLMREQRIALETLLGMGLPDIHPLAGNR